MQVSLVETSDSAESWWLEIEKWIVTLKDKREKVQKKQTEGVETESKDNSFKSELSAAV